MLGDSVTEWTDGVDTPLTVMTTRAPAVLKTQHYAFCFFQSFVFRTKPHIHTLRESIYLLNFRVNVRRIVWRLQIWFNVMNEKLITSTLTHFFLCLHHLILPADPAKPIQKAALWKIFDIFKQFGPSSLMCIHSVFLLLKDLIFSNSLSPWSLVSTFTLFSLYKWIWSVSVCVSIITSKMTIISACRLHRPL